jgi:peptidyl-prolyl cis-trans isomerase B (cyclophilin B)
MRQKFIDAQNDPEETQKLAISLSEICEEKYGMQIRKTISDEILKAYTTVGGVPHLDGAYTVFGRIVEGLEVIDKIASVKTGAADKPVEDIPMTFKIKKISKEKITKDYGYSYPQ